MDMTQNNTADYEETTQSYHVLQELGDCYASVGNYERAQGCYEKAASLEPDVAEPYVGLGVIALQNNLFDEAKIAFQVACRLDRQCSGAYAGLAMISQQSGDYPHAFDMYLKCLDLDTDNLTALLGLFQTSCQMGSFEKVTYYLEEYLEMHPGDIAVMFSLAALYIKDSRLEDSRQTLLNIMSLEPSNVDAVNLLEEVEHNIEKKKNDGIMV